MRAVLERRSPAIRCLDARAESLPVEDASFDVVLSSSAWHWFDQPGATHEAARVLVDGGTLWVLWNGFASGVAWVDALTALRDSTGDPGWRPRGRRADLDGHGTFVDVTDVDLEWTWRRTREEMVGLFGTYSGSIRKSAEERLAMLATLNERFDELAPDGYLDVPMSLRGPRATRAPR
jgi:SAM-dependent methyltransferase